MSKTKKLKSILISLLLAIVILQGLWINDAYRERKIHLKTHIQSSVLHSINSYCINNNGNINLAETNIRFLIIDELNNLNENINFQIRIVSSKYEYLNKKDAVAYHLNCKNNLNHKYLVFIPESTSIYVFNSILNWILLSLLFIILLSIFTGLYFKDISSNKQLQAMKDDFIGNMTHELKTPISTISVASEILQNDRIIDNPNKIKQYSQIIFEENNRLKRLVDRVMQVGLFEEGKLIINKERCNINELIEETYLPLKLVIEKHKGIITANLEASNPFVEVDLNHIKNVISNIIENAIKYSNNNLKININTITNNNGVTVEIIDNGIGISKENQKHIFEKYYRSNSVENNKKTGFGIGLFYVYQVIKAHGATIKVKSEINEGSMFILHFSF